MTGRNREALREWERQGGHDAMSNDGLGALVVPWFGVILNTPAIADERLSSEELLVALVVGGCVEATPRNLAALCRMPVETVSAIASRLVELGHLIYVPAEGVGVWEETRWRGR